MEIATRWLRDHGPDVRDAISRFKVESAIAAVPTPLPNPEIVIGPQFGSGSDLGDVNKTTAFGSLDIAIPIGQRRYMQDDLNRIRAEAARVEAIATFRQSYLRLRSTYVALIASHQRLEQQREIQENSKSIAEAIRRMVVAGQGTALDVSLFELERNRDALLLQAFQRSRFEVEGELSRLTGVHYGNFSRIPAEGLPSLPDEVIQFDDLRETLIKNHVELSRLRAAYDVAECRLRLELSMQIPDLKLLPDWGEEVGERKTVIGLGIGIELPLFDRNQQGIAEALALRENVRRKYESEASRALAELERAYRSLAVARESRRLLEEDILPKAEESLKLARESINAGAGNTVLVLDTVRTLKQLRIQTLDSYLTEFQSWSSIETIVGHPILQIESVSNEEIEPPTDLVPLRNLDRSKK